MTQARPVDEDSDLAQATSPTLSRRHHILDLDDFTRDEITEVLDNTAAMAGVLKRDIRKVPALRGKTVITLFHEASTRTRVSFEQAGKVLSADVINVTGSGTSVEKGESLYNTALTLQAMNADIIVVRHPDAGAPHFLARHLNSSVINAGDGTHAHPTQALLDLYTLRSRLGRLEGLKVAIVGDILHSRVARSNLWGLTAVGAEVVLCGPPTLMPIDLVNGERTAEGHPFAAIRTETSVERAIEGADAVMVLRIQSERQRGGFMPSLREYSRMYGINAKRMELAKPEALVMHPGPMNEGVEIDSEVAHGARSVIEEQVANGVAVRMALMFGIITPAPVSARSRN
jgi:aspartate carbamoyltransferase catalytic subunit